MKKFLTIAGLTVGFIVCMWVMIAIQPATNALVATANTTANWTGYETAQSIVGAWPLYYWFIPIGIYLIVIALVLKADPETL